MRHPAASRRKGVYRTLGDKPPWKMKHFGLILLIGFSGCVSQVYLVEGARQTPARNRLYLHLPDGVSLESVNGEVTALWGARGPAVFAPGKYELELGLIRYSPAGSTESPRKIQVPFSGGPGEVFYGCLQSPESEDWGVRILEEKQSCSGFRDAGTAIAEYDEVEHRYYHRDAAFKDRKHLVRVNFAEDTRLDAIDRKPLIALNYRVAYLEPGNWTLNVSLFEESGNSWTYSMAWQDVTIEGVAGSEYFVCSQRLPADKWKAVLSRNEFACD